MIADQLLPEVLKDLWQQADEPNCTGDQYERKRRHCLDRYRRVWKQAPLLDGYTSLRDSLLLELGEYVGRQDPAELERRCAIAWKRVEDEWLKSVDAGDPGPIDRFYDRSEAYLYNLTWWHTLIEDDTPLAYVTALHFARRQGLLIGDRTGRPAVRPARV